MMQLKDLGKQDQDKGKVVNGMGKTPYFQYLQKITQR